MTRFQTHLVTAVATSCAGLLPIGVALYYSWVAAVGSEQQRLGTIAERATLRADRVYGTTLAVLKELDGYQGGRCTPEHIALMQAAEARTPGLRNIAVIAQGRIACYAWGGAALHELPRPDALTSDKAALWYGASFPGAPAGMIAVRSVEHIALLNSQQIAGAIDAGPGTTFVLVARGSHRVLSASGNLPADRVIGAAGRSSALPAASMMVVKVEAKHWPVDVYVASRPSGVVGGNWLREAQERVPLGAIAGALAALLAYYLTRRSGSPVSKLRRALRRREFVLRYQPVIELATGTCVGAEALVRWRRPDRGMVAPDRFIPLAEQTGLIRAMTEAIIGTVLAEIGPILRSRRDLHVAVNLASMDFNDHGIADLFARALEGRDITPDQVAIETTERGMLDHDAAREVIAALRARGHSIAIDDFGTGYSNLASLQSIAVDVLKIDKLFIDRIGAVESGEDAGSVIPHIVEMAKALRLRTVAEGVETAAQMRYLRAQGVDFAQGWYFSKPLTADAFRDFLRRTPQRAAATVAAQVI